MPLSVAALLALLLAPPAKEADATAIGPAIETYCLGCHEGPKAKGSLDLTDFSVRTANAGVVRAVRDRLRRGDMPPEGKERPDSETYAALVAELDRALDARAARASPGRPTLRRLNRVEYRNSVRAVAGVDLDVQAALPADDVGEGFDQIGDVLSMPPTLLEKYLDLAERVALVAWPDPATSQTFDFGGGKLTVPEGGAVQGSVASVWSAGEAFATVELPRDGRYRVTFRAGGDQAGPEPVKVAVRIGKDRRAYFDIPEERTKPGTRSCEMTIAGGRRRIGIEFLNDFYREDLPPGQRDRNLHVFGVRIEGPLDPAGPSAEALRYGEGPELEPFAARLLAVAFRRPADETEVRAFADRVRTAAGDGAAWPLQARTALIAALVDPRFLFRVERDPPRGQDSRPLDRWELATRLSYFLWSGPPDASVDPGDSAASLAACVDRMLDDPRSLSLAEHFGQQWLLIRDIETRQPDPSRFPGVDAGLLADMKAETTLFLDAMIREDRPMGELLTADWTFLDQRLAAHYGLPGVEGDWLRRVRLGERRVPGLLGHGSVLVATSNPTRTSPVKRGKWVLDALLDEAPPPPPPGTPLLPERGAAGAAPSMRERLAAHRADPACAACHRQMDAIGFGLEPLDPVGRARSRDEGEPIDATGQLADGRRFEGPVELAGLLHDDPAVVRSVLRHLMTYALGRGLAGDDLAVVDHIARTLGPDATMRQVIQAVVASEQFRCRAAPPPEPAKETP